MNIFKERFAGKTILITGATSGIGEATALRAAAEGANVVVAGRDEQRGQAVVEKIKLDGGDAIFVKGDLTNENDVVRLIKTAEDKFGDIQLFVNNAGVASDPDRVDEYSTEQWLRIMDINVNSVFYCCREELKHLLKHDKGGAIVNLSSVAGVRAFPSACGYVTSKHAIVGLTKAIAMEYAHKNIRCNSTGPCSSSTPLNINSSLAYGRKLRQLIDSGIDTEEYIDEWMCCGKMQAPMGRDCVADEQAAVILFLLSDDASYITGDQIVVDGGWVVY